MSTASNDEITDEVQDVIEQIDDELKSALELANQYTSHDEVRPSAVMAFDHVEEARLLLDEIDEREFSGDVE